MPHTPDVWRLFAVCFIALGPDQPPSLAPPVVDLARRVEAAAPPPIPKLPVTPHAWTFAVLSDIHAPNDGKMWPAITKTVAALVAMHPRAVVITGDFTNGLPTDSAGRIAGTKKLWRAIAIALEPLRAARIPVLPVAGNHDAYVQAQRDLYAAAFADLDAWAAPLRVHRAGEHALASAPFSYSVDLDRVHFTLAHLVDRRAHKDVDDWIAADLARAAKARLRIVFGHVPMSSVAVEPKQEHIARFGAILERGHADLLIAGHEHLVWDENVALPGGGSIREILVGCASGWYNFAPGKHARARAHCTPIAIAGKKSPQRCAMPNGGGEFVIASSRKGRLIQHAKATFTLVTIAGAAAPPIASSFGAGAGAPPIASSFGAGTQVTVTPMTLDADGRPIPFYLHGAAPPPDLGPPIDEPEPELPDDEPTDERAP